MKKYFPVYFAPDLDPDWNVNPGVLTSVTDLYPSKNGGLRSYYAAIANSVDTYVLTTYGNPLVGFGLQNYDGTAYAFTCTTKRILKAGRNSSLFPFVDVSLGGVNYTTASDWDMAAWGNNFMAVSKVNAPQVSVSGGTFANLGGTPPKASAICVNLNFTFLGDCNDGSSDLGDQVWWSGIGNNATWSPSLATQAGNYRLRDTPGAITSLIPMGDNVIAYKANSMYVGSYVGGSTVWSWRCLNHKVGCSSLHGVAELGGTHYFIHNTNVYSFDGQTVKPIGSSVINWLNVSQAVSLGYEHGVVDEREGVVFFYLRPTSTTTAFTGALTLNVNTGKFGWIATPVTGAQALGTWRGYAPAWLASASVTRSMQPGLLVQSGTVGSFIANIGSYTTSTQTVTGGYFGSDTEKSLMIRVVPHFNPLDSVNASSITAATVYAQDRITDLSATGATFTVDGEKCNGRISGNWLKPQLSFKYRELMGMTLMFESAGKE